MRKRAMKARPTTIEQQFAPGAVQMFLASRASVIVAIDGPLKLEYRDDSLSWLTPAVRPVLVVLDEGQSHEMPYGAWVNISAQGRQTVQGLLISPPSWVMRLASIVGFRSRVRELARACS
jgi:hypothetical protein